MDLHAILSFLASYWYVIPLGIIALIILIKIIPRYIIVPPDTALIVSGLLRRNYKVRTPEGSVKPPSASG